MSSTISHIFAFAVGACIGSFLNVCILRWPKERSIVKPRSRCTQCGHELAWFENIPIVSWIVLRAKCRCCEESISSIYPLIELSVGLGWMLAFHVFGATFLALRVAVFGTVLLGIAMTDVRHYVIPDGFTVFGLLWALVTSIASFFSGDTTIFAAPYEALVGACAGAGVIAIVGWLGEVTLKKEAMGMGDVTLMAFVGAALGPQRALLTVFMGATLGAVTFLGFVYPIAWMRRSTGEQHELALGSAPLTAPLVPFGVFLAPAALLTLLWGDAVLSWVLRV